MAGGPQLSRLCVLQILDSLRCEQDLSWVRLDDEIAAIPIKFGSSLRGFLVGGMASLGRDLRAGTAG